MSKTDYLCDNFLVSCSIFAGVRANKGLQPLECTVRAAIAFLKNPIQRNNIPVVHSLSGHHSKSACCEVRDLHACQTTVYILNDIYLKCKI